MLKALFLGLCALAIVSCSDDETTGPDTSGTTENSFVSKQGDASGYDVYSLDENNEPESTTATYSTRTVLRTNMSYKGETDVTMAVDSLFASGNTEVISVDTIYYRVNSNSLYIYNFANTFTGLIPEDSPFQLEPIASWVKVAELKEQSSSFTSSLKLNMVFAGTPTELTVNIQGQNQGKTTSDVGGKTYTVFRQQLTGTANLGIASITIPMTLEIGGVKNSSNSPNTMVKLQINKFTNPLDQSVVTGRTQLLASFKAGS